MKFSVAFLLILSWISVINSSPVRQTRSLEDDLNDFLELLPLDTILPLVQEYVANDKEIQHVIEYVRTEDFKDLVRLLDANEAVLSFVEYLHESGLDVHTWANAINDFLGLPPLYPKRLFAISGGMAGLVGDIQSLLPLEEIKALYYDKLEHSEDFKKLIDRLHSPKLQAIVDELSANEEVQHILETLKAAGVDVKAIGELLTKILGIKFPEHSLRRSARSLTDDFEDFAALVPVEKIVPIVKEYLENDAEVKHIVEYIKSKEFSDLVVAVESIEDVLNFYNYIQESGLDIYAWVNELHQAIGLPALNPPSLSRKITGGVAGLVADVKAELPLDKFAALYEEKLKTSAEFKNLVDRLKSPKFQAVVDKVVQNKEFVHIIAKAREYGINVDAVADVVSTILGVKFPEHSLRRSVRSLTDDFEDFAALVPVEKISPIVKEYLETDAEVKHIVEYIKSKEFSDLVVAVESIEDVLNFYNYIQESGLDIYAWVNELHQAIGLPALSPPSLNRKITGGIAGLVADVKAELPLDKFAALYEEKLKTSAEFKNLVDRLKSPKFQAVVDKVVQNKEFVHIIAKAREYGINVDAVADVVSTILGVKFPEHRVYRNARGLNDDLQDFLALIPQDEVTEIFQEYLFKDKEVQAAFEYIQGAEFRQLVKAVESIDDVINFYNYIQESGLDIYGAVNQLHDIIGLPHLKPKRSLVEITGGINGLIQDIKKILPIEQIKALYHEKLESSPEFKKLVDRLHSPKFQAVVDTLLANEEFQEIVKAAKEAGVDVAAVTDLLATIFGLKFPSTKSRVIRDVEAHLEDFFFLLPFDKITEIAVTFLVNDPEVQEAARYVQSEEFKELLVKLQQEKDIQDVMKYINDSGLDLYSLINLLNDLLGVPHFPEPLAKSFGPRTGETTGVHGMLNAIREVLPYDEIQSLYEEKFETSEDFRFFIERFKAPEFQAFVDKLVVNEAFVELGHQAYVHGIDIKKISDFLQELLGIKFPEGPFPFEKRLSREATNLNDDLMEFVDILPVDSIVKTALTYAFSDKETQEAIEYMRSEEFKNIVRELDRIPEYIEILQELDSAGLEVYHWIQIFHKFIGFDDHIPMFMGSAMGKPGISGLIEELKKLLPHEQIKELYYEKLETSPAFANFVSLIKSDNFQTVTNDLFANKDFQNLLHEARKHGVDLQKIADFFLRVFGIATPPGVIDP